MLDRKKRYLQIALNSTLSEAYSIIDSLPPSERILIEAGTPLIKRYGIEAISSLYGWWQKTAHRSHLVLDEVRDPSFLTPTKKEGKYLARLMLAQIPGVGWEKSGAIVAMFPALAMVRAAGVKALQQIDGVGPVLAQRIVEAL